MLSRTTRVSQHQKGKSNLDGFIGAKDSQWQWHQLSHMQICTLTQTHYHASIPPLIIIAEYLHRKFVKFGRVVPMCRQTDRQTCSSEYSTPLPELGVNIPKVTSVLQPVAFTTLPNNIETLTNQAQQCKYPAITMKTIHTVECCCLHHWFSSQCLWVAAALLAKYSCPMMNLFCSKLSSVIETIYHKHLQQAPQLLNPPACTMEFLTTVHPLHKHHIPGQTTHPYTCVTCSPYR